VPILSTLFGLYAIYRFCKLYYSEQVAYIAALVMGSCQAFFLMNHDVRCDTLLTNCVTVSVWMLAEYLTPLPPYGTPPAPHREGGIAVLAQKRSLSLSKWKWLIGAFGFMGLGMLAKGPIAVIVVGAAFFVDFALKRDWKQIFRWEWLVGILATGVVLIPYCIGVYRQYGDEGLYFFFWKQSFGRITGESEWSNSPGLLFQTQNFLWSFLPWVLVFALALFARIREIVKNGFKIASSDEAISLGGFVLPFAALSTAQYQLPHYTFVVFPLAAVLTARYLEQCMADYKSAGSWVGITNPDQHAKRSIPFAVPRVALVVTSCVMVLVVLILSVWAFPLQSIVLWMVFGLLTFLIFRLYSKKRPPFSQMVFAPFLTAIAANLMLNAHFYPSLLPYQTGSQLGQKIMREQAVPLDRFYKFDVLPAAEYQIFHDALDFYTRHTTPVVRRATQIDSLAQNSDVWLFTEKKGLAALQQQNLQADTLWQHDRFHVTGLTLPFLNPATRLQETSKQYLVRVKKLSK
jgi:4-amino-4-deoxy-L-arabinose transferase-like glycosyltransferase